MPISWDPGLFKIGVEEVDKQHAVFFEKIDILKNAYGTENEKEIIGQIIDFLWDYAQHHFKYEEELMEKFSFPGLERQRMEHRFFIENYIKLKDMFETEGPSRKLMLYVYNYVFKWLVEHISAEDKEFAAFANRDA